MGRYGMSTGTQIVPFMFDREALAAFGRERAESYRRAKPFPHGVFDDFVPEDVAQRAYDEFPDDDAPWEVYTDEGNTRKLATSDVSLMGPATRQLIGEFNGRAMIEFLEALTGIEGLVPDPHLVGGGLHQIERGGFLKVHADFNRHTHLRLDRRVNVLLYLTPDWREEWGGHLELWPRDMSAAEQRVLPIAGRCVVFDTTDDAFHGHPEPLSSPPGVPRRSLAFYYYTNGRPLMERSAEHSTLYQQPGKPLRAGASRARRALKMLVPPIVVELARRLKRRR